MFLRRGNCIQITTSKFSKVSNCKICGLHSQNFSISMPEVPTAKLTLLPLLIIQGFYVVCKHKITPPSRGKGGRKETLGRLKRVCLFVCSIFSRSNNWMKKDDDISRGWALDAIFARQKKGNHPILSNLRDIYL